MEINKKQALDLAKLFALIDFVKECNTNSFKNLMFGELYQLRRNIDRMLLDQEEKPYQAFDEPVEKDEQSSGCPCVLTGVSPIVIDNNHHSDDTLFGPGTVVEGPVDPSEGNMTADFEAVLLALPKVVFRSPVPMPSCFGRFVKNSFSQLTFTLESTIDSRPVLTRQVFAVMRTGTKLKIRTIDDGSWEEYSFWNSDGLPKAWTDALPMGVYLEVEQ